MFKCGLCAPGGGRKPNTGGSEIQSIYPADSARRGNGSFRWINGREKTAKFRLRFSEFQMHTWRNLLRSPTLRTPPLLGKLSSESADFFFFSSSPTAFLVRHQDATARVCAAASDASLCLSAFPAAPQRKPGPAGGATLRRLWLTLDLRLPPAPLAPAAHCPKNKKKGKRKEKKEHNFKTGRKLGPQ